MADTRTRIILTATDRTKAAFKSASRSVSGLERTVSKATAAFATFVGVGAVGGLVKSVADAGLQMERFRRTFGAVAGSAEGAARELEFVTELSKRLGLDLETAAGSFARLSAAAKGTSLAGAETRKVFTAVSEASVVLGLTAEQTEGTLIAIEQIISKGKVSSEELRRQLGDRLPGAFQIAARAIGVTTAELDDMLRKGELTAEELLPKLAVELRNTYGSQVQEAINSAQAAIGRFNTAIFELKSAIAESGVLDALASFAQGIANVISPSLSLEIQRVNNDIGNLTAQITRLKAEDKPGAGGLIASLQKKLDAANAEMAELLQKAGRLNLARVGGSGGEKVSEELGEISDEAKSFIRQFETAEQKVERLRAELTKFKGEIKPEEFQRIWDQIGETLNEGIEEIDTNGFQKMKRLYKGTVEDMDEFTKQAARNMQDAFADFLFDPFEEGLDGMLESFLNVLRRMIAEAAAAQIFNQFDFGSLFSGFFNAGTGAATGAATGTLGPVSFGGSASAGKALSGGVSKMITNYYSFEAGADIATIRSEIVPLLQQTSDATVARIYQDKAEGRI